MAFERSNNPAASTYREQEILGEGPLARVARLYDMAGLELARARAALRSSDPAAKGRAVGRACDCLSLLQASLNLERGGEVAANLDRIYNYLLRRLSEAHLRNDDCGFAEIARHLGQLGSAWRELAGRQEPAATAAARPVAEAAAAR